MRQQLELLSAGGLSVAKTLTDVLEQSGIPIQLQVGGTPPSSVVDREIKKSLRPAHINCAISISYAFVGHQRISLLVHAQIHQLEGEMPVVRRAAALKEAFSHLTPTIYPGELMVMGGLIITAVLIHAVALGRLLHGQGGRTVPGCPGQRRLQRRRTVEVRQRRRQRDRELRQCRLHGRKVRHARKKFPHSAHRQAVGRTSRSTTWATNTSRWCPEYPIKEAIMRNVVCMFDPATPCRKDARSINYYYPLSTASTA